MNYELKVNKDDVCKFLYSMLEVYWLSESISSLKMIKNLYGISPTSITFNDENFFLINVDSKNKIGNYISSECLEDIIMDSIDDTMLISAVCAYETGDDKVTEFILEMMLHRAIDTFLKNPTKYNVLPFPVNFEEGALCLLKNL